MSLFRAAQPVPAISLRHDDLLMQTPTLNDYAQWREVRGQSRHFLSPWEPLWADDDLEIPNFRRRIARYDRERQNDITYTVFLYLAERKVLIGGLSLSQVRRGVAQAGTMGYWMGALYANRGYMSKALPVFCAYCFEKLKLERIEAAAQPDNPSSLRLLRKSGFTEEGFARSYLRIAGQRRDHIMFSLLPADAKKSKTTV